MQEHMILLSYALAIIIITCACAIISSCLTVVQKSSKIIMSSDSVSPRPVGLLLNYFSRSTTSLESTPPLSEDSLLPESDASSSSDHVTTVEIPEASQDCGWVVEPYQPRNIVSKFGTQSRSFQVTWFDKWKWLDWNDKKQSVFCHPCRNAVRLNFTLCKKAEPAFSVVGFRNWKDAVCCFRKHEDSCSHKDASLQWLHYTKSQSVASQLSNQVSSDQAIAKDCLLKIITTLLFVAHQGLAIRGHDESQGNLI